MLYKLIKKYVEFKKRQKNIAKCKNKNNILNNY